MINRRKRIQLEPEGINAKRPDTSRRTAERSGITDLEWWNINAPVLERVMPPGKYPISGRVGQVAGEEYHAVGDPLRSFEFGLDRILDGLEKLLAR